ncbi:MAG: glycosyltransferase [Bacteroidota bacterium]
MNGLKRNKNVKVIKYPLSDLDFSLKKFKSLIEESDYIYIPPFRHSDVKGIRKLANKPIIFDPLISKYLTRTIDYGKWWTAPEKYLRDWVAFKNSDIILMDTQEDKNFIIKKYNLSKENILVVPIGVDTSIFKPELSVPNKRFTIGFHGGFIPLQGIDKIVEAALILKNEDVIFDIVGSGPLYKKIKKLSDRLNPGNIKFRGWVDYDKISPIINQFDLCLGIFGDSIKTDMVVPNKVYEYAAIKKCIITKDTPAIKEIFIDNSDIKMTTAHPEKIAEAIIELKSDFHKREKISENAYKLITGSYDEKGIAKILVEKLKSWRLTVI